METNEKERKGVFPDHYSELLFDKNTDKEIESFLKQELIREQDVSQDDVIQTQHANEQTCSTPDANHANITKEEVHSSLEIRNRMQIETKGSEKQKDKDETSPRKRLHNNDENEKIDYDVRIVENVGVSSLEGMENPGDLSESKTGKKANPNVNTKVKELAAEANSFKMPPMWNNYILAVRGIPPRQSGHLKRILNDTLDDDCHRIRPCQKGDTAVYLHFRQLGDMELARESLDNQSIADYKLTVTVERAPELKDKSKGDHDRPVSKRMRKQEMSYDEQVDRAPGLKDKSKGDHHRSFSKRMRKQDLLLQFYEMSYEEQVERKMADIRSKLQALNKYIGRRYPKSSNFIHQRQLKHDGMICALDKFKDCSPSERIVSTCTFEIGTHKETGQIVLGVLESSGHVRKLSSVKPNYPDHVVKVAEVFEKFVHAQGKQNIWNKLVIHTNNVQDLMLSVYVDCTNDEMKQVHDEMKIFFTSGEGMKCHVISVYVSDPNNRDNKDAGLGLVLGAPYLEDTIAGIKLQFPPMKRLWNSVHGAETLCKSIEELLRPSKRTTVLEIGCGVGLVGLYLSKVAGEVLSVDTESTVEIAKKNAALNGITNCRHFGGKAEDVIPILANKRRYDRVCAVVMFSLNRSYKNVTALKQLSKIQHLDQLVLVEDKAFSFSAILALSTRFSEKEMGNPFLPVKAVPVDLQNLRGYLLLILLERIGHYDMQRFSINDKPVPRKSELITEASASRKPYVRVQQGDGRLLPISVWERTPFLQQSCDVGPEIRAEAVHNSLFQNTAFNIQLQAAEEIQRAYFGAVSNVANVADEYYLREMLIEKQRRQVEEEEQRRQMDEAQVRQIQEEEWNRRMLEGKKRQIQVEEEWIRQVQEEEQRRRILEQEQRIREEDWIRCIQEDERRRQIQEEEERRIQEEQRRRIQEEEERKIQQEELRRRIQEEDERRIQEEEWRRRIQEEEQRRQLLEEEQKREMLTEGWKRRIQDEWMRQMHGENYRRPILEETYRGRMEEEDLRRQIEEERERELVRMSLNLRSKTDMVEDLIADSLREAAVPQLSADTAEKVKQLVAEAIRNVGVANQDERHGVVSTSRGVGGIHPEEITVSQFGMPDKEMPEAGVFERGNFRHIRELDYLPDRRHVYGDALQRHGFEQDDQKPQQYSLSRNQKISSEMSLKVPSLLDLKLKPPELSGASSHDMQHPEDRSFYLDVNTNQGLGQVLTAQKELDIHAKRGRQPDRFSGHAIQDVGSARRDRKSKEFSTHAEHDRLASRPSSHATQGAYSPRSDSKSAFSFAVEQDADIFKRRGDLD